MPTKHKASALIFVRQDDGEMVAWYPKYRLEAAGYDAPLARIGDPKCTENLRDPCPVDGNVRDFVPDTLAGILATGSWGPDKLRREPAGLAKVREVNSAGGLVATICHRPWILMSAGTVKGRRA